MINFKFRFGAGSLLCILAVVFFTSMSFLIMESQPIKTVSPLEFLKQNWQIIALIVSEIIPFLPVKAGGILNAIYRVLTAIGKKN